MITLIWGIVTSKVGRWVILALAVLVLAGWAVLHIQHQAVATAEAKANQDALERLQNALHNGDAVPADPSQLRGSDPHCRDC